MNVHIPRLFFCRISWQLGFVLSNRLGVEKDTPHTFDNHWPYYVFLVRFRNMLWMGVLPLYVEYYIDKLTGFTWDPLVVDSAVLILGLVAFALSCWLNWKDWNSHQYARLHDSSLK